MAINDVNQEYDTNAKSEWRALCHSLITPTTCSYLVDDDGAHKFKWVELVAKEAKTFSYALSNGKITEDKLIGINNDMSIIKSCQPIFPSATFIHSEWDDFCLSYNNADIGVVVFDSCNAAYGFQFEKSLRITLNLVEKSINNIGECMLVINVDGDKTYRGKAVKRTEKVDAITKAKFTMCDTINKIFASHNNKSIHDASISPETIYQYNQTNNSTTMLSCFNLFG